MDTLQVKKTLNNNVIIGLHPAYGEVVVIGKGIGFNRHAHDRIPLNSIEKMFILTKEEEMEQYKQLIHQMDETFIEVMNDAIFYISQHAPKPLDEHIHIALTDHIAFAVKRFKQGIPIHNPFLHETEELYPTEFALARHVVEEVNRRCGIRLPDDEVGFVAYYVYSAFTDKHVSDIKAHSALIKELVGVIEQKLQISIKKDSVNYSRLLRHLMVAFERIRRGEESSEPSKINAIIKNEYPEMYSIAWSLIKIIQQRLNKPVYDTEAVYLTIHLQRLNEKQNSSGGSAQN